MKLFIIYTKQELKISGLKISGSLVAKLARLDTSKTIATNNTDCLSTPTYFVVTKIFMSF